MPLADYAFADHMNKRPITSFILLTYAISWSAWGIGYLLSDDNINLIFLVMGSFGPALAAVTINNIDPGTTPRYNLARFSNSYINYFISLSLFPVLFSFVVLFLIMTKAYPTPHVAQISFLNIGLLFPVNVLLGGALGEEIGWRGFLLPKLKRRYPNALTSLFIGIVWATWHVPLFLSNTYTNPMLQYVVIVILNSFIFTILANRSPNNIWPVILLHASFNIMNVVLGDLFPSSDGLLEADWNYFIVVQIVFVSIVYAASSLKTSRLRA